MSSAGDLGTLIGNAGRDLFGAAASGAPPTANVSHQASVWAVIGGGILLVILADYAPHIVNGVLVLLLAGVVLRRSDVWIPWLNGVGAGLGK